ncbi:putative endo-1,3(4)-beta-glucanase [Beauveria bassiana]|uniref:Putative endo-1,3(4)-beta-glucanase n=1 Tax=Beauveria bassiana TaxID=176275 RepID=A0A2N6NK77_BEABA|nr:putative endo-1,3(4)-beta-glucanase [Beauveria bassiana]
MPSLISCLVAGLAVVDRAAAAKYSLSKTYDSSNFLTEFHFRETGTIPERQDDNWSWVKYQNVNDAQEKGLVSVKDNKVYLGVDFKTTLKNDNDGPRRDTLRVQSKWSFKEGLVITRFWHMPKPVCGAWPAYWTLGEDWPNNGEIDMYEGWNLHKVNKPALHTAPETRVGQCYLDKSAQAKIVSDNCDNSFENRLNAWKGQGCQVEEVNDGIWGSPDGGIQALEWTKDTIKLYTWPIGQAPKNIDSDTPDTSSWGTPSVQLSSPRCDTSRAFGKQTILFTLPFCGEPVGNTQFWTELPADSKSGKTCKQITGADTCVKYVAENPEAFKEFYFGINDVRLFVQDAEDSENDNKDTKGQLSLDSSSSSALKFKYATSQSSSDNWIGIWPEDDTQAPTWGSITWDYAKESSGSLTLAPPSSMKAGKYKAYLLSSDRKILAPLSTFDYKPESSDDNKDTKDQLSLDSSSSSALTFKYATSQSSSDNWIGIWPEDDKQAPTWGSITWDYAKESSGSLTLTPPSSMKAGGKYKAYLLSSDRKILAFLSTFDYKPESSDDNKDTKGQLSLDSSSSSSALTFKYATSQSSSDNWIGIWSEDDTQAPTWGSITWDYAKESSGTLTLAPPSSMKAGGKYKAYLLSSDRKILAFLSTFDYKPESSSNDNSDSSSVAFSVKARYNINCGGSVTNNVDIQPGSNGVCVRTNCNVGSLEIPSAGSCPDGQVRISFWQNADCDGDWYGYGYASRGTCRGLWTNGWGFKSLWLSCADPASDCIQQGTCTAAPEPEPAMQICRA